MRYNFSAGPSPLPAAVIQQIRADLPDWNGQGASIMEISHRSGAFAGVAQQAESDLRQLLDLSDRYRVLWLQGGASSQFSLIPLNFAHQQPGGYVLSGHWSVKAWETAMYHGQPLQLASSAPDYTRLPDRDLWQTPADLAYVHVTANETIHGVQYQQSPTEPPAPLIIDASSDFLSRPPVFQRYGMMYAGAQKNLGPAGITLVIIHEDLLARCPHQLAPMFNYRTQADKQSLYNTPPVFSWYVCGLVLRWLIDQGGLEAMARINAEKARRLYAELDRDDFYRNPVLPAHRSQMNIPFRIHDPTLEKVFLDETADAGFIGLKGHRSVGGLRASLYNAVSLEQTQALINFMQQFRTHYG
ncbi:MAG: 3-phosphoserine/phosphohydroxythreonine transaminase [Wenzhouxiangellaceae bacterium]